MSRYWGNCPVCSGTKFVVGTSGIPWICGTCNGTGNADVEPVYSYEQMVAEEHEEEQTVWKKEEE